MTTINGKPVSSFVRTPKKGSFLANVSLGGSEYAIDVKKLPEELLLKVKKINERLKKYRPSIFASDFMNSKEGFKLVELNSRPGLLDYNYSPLYKKYDESVAKMLIKNLS